MLERPDQERAELAPALVGQGDIFLFQEQREELLRQILGIRWRMPFAADEHIQGIPIRPAKPLQRLSSRWGILLSSFQHDAPVGGGKSTTARRSFQACL